MKKFKILKTSKRIMTLLLSLVLILGLAGCGGSTTQTGTSSDDQKESSSKVQPESSSEESVGSGCTYDFPSTGFGFDLPEGMEISKGFIYCHDSGDMDYDSGVMMGWPVYYDITEEKYNNLKPEDVGTYKTAFAFQVFCVKDVDTLDAAIEKMITETEKATGEKMSQEELEATKKMKELHKENGYFWVLYGNSKGEVREECQEEYQAFYDAIDDITQNHMKFYEPLVWKGSEEGSNISFETEDLNGNPVKADSLFSHNKVTMINIWGTTCGPCIQEMPELEKYNKEIAKKGGTIIGIVKDVPLGNNLYLQEAKDIVKDTGVTFLNLRAWDDLEDTFSSIGTPTTYFVDSKGNIIGNPILGANVKKYKETMDQLLSEAE